MNKTRAWIVALGVSAVIVAGAMVGLASHGDGGPRPSTQASALEAGTQRAAETTQASASPGTAASPTAAASATQVQQVLLGVLAQLQTALVPADGQLKPAATPAEIEVLLRAELAKVGLHP